MEKPDFYKIRFGKFIDLEALLESLYEQRTTSTQAEFNIVSELDSIWSSHVEPLQKENEILRIEWKEMHIKFHETNDRIDLLDEKNEQLEAERDKLKSENEIIETQNIYLNQENKGLRKENERLKEERQFLLIQLDKNRDVIWMNNEAWTRFGEILYPHTEETKND